MNHDWSNTEIVSGNTSCFGGIAPVLKQLEKNFKIPEVAEKCFGKRVAQAQYSNYDCFRNFLLTLVFNEEGYRMIKIEETKANLSVFKHLNVCSHDTSGRFMKKLATADKIQTTQNKKNPNKKPKAYVVNENIPMNRFNIETSIACGNLIPGVPYTLDLDVTALVSKVKESIQTYKRHKGFMPMVAMIGKNIVYTSMRSGNTGPHYRKLDALKNCITLLREYGIVVARVRIDGAGYKNEILDYLQVEGIKFVINANWSMRTYNLMNKSIQWKKKSFKTSKEHWKDAELGSFNFNLAKSDKTYRLAVIRTKAKMRTEEDEYIPETKIEGDSHKYRFVITNDWDINEYDLIKEYHLRGDAEKNFASLKKYFGWNIMPFSKLNENHVYLLMTAICHNIYQALLNVFSKLTKVIGGKILLKTFRLKISNILCRINKKGKIEFSGFKADLLVHILV